MGYYEGEIGSLCGNGGNNGFGGGWEGLIGLIIVAGMLNRNGGGLFGGGGGNDGGGEFTGWQLGRLASTNDVASGFNNSAVLSGLNDLKLGQAQAINYNNQGFAGLNQTITNGFAGVNNAVCTLGYQNAQLVNGLSREFSDCCCKTQRAIDGVNYNIATQFGGLNNTLCNLGRDIIENQNANYRAIHEELVAGRLEAKDERIAELQDKLYRADLRASQAQQSNYITDTILNKLSPCPSPSYIVPNPNCCYDYRVSGVGYGGNGGGNCGCGCNGGF